MPPDRPTSSEVESYELRIMLKRTCLKGITTADGIPLKVLFKVGCGLDLAVCDRRFSAARSR